MFIFFSFFFIYSVRATDLAIAYNRTIRVIRNADLDSPHSVESIPAKVGLPVALYFTQDKLFFSDYDNEDHDILSLSLAENKIESVVNSYVTSNIESVTLDYITKKLYWADSFKYGIYTNATVSGKSYPELVHKVLKPRSVAVDSCNQILYWSDRNGDRPSIQELNVRTNKVVTFRQNKGYFYQAMGYDINDRQLWWAETNSDKYTNSSCKIVTMKDNVEIVAAVLNKCYPFSFSFDSHYIYWSDWASGGVVRMSKSEPTDIELILRTPADRTASNFGTYGIANLNYTVTASCAYAEASFISSETSKSSHSSKSLDYMSDSPPHVPISSGSSSNFEIFPKKNTPLGRMKELYNRLHYVTLGLSIVAFFLLIVIAILLKILYTRYSDILQNILLFKEKEMKKKPRKFGPKQHGWNGRSQCAIDIENCCQMTLCEKPCNIAMEKISRAAKSKSEDKMKLLDSVA